jgi:predicted nuclease of predicted toxin-antitoxin system
VKFPTDAQLPARLARFLTDAGHDCVHTSDLPAGNRSSEGYIIEVADREGRVVVTKDRDFRDSHLLRGTPRRLLMVTTGNITNNELITLFGNNLSLITKILEEERFVEMRAGTLIVHRARPDTPLTD